MELEKTERGSILSRSWYLENSKITLQQLLEHKKIERA